MLDRAVSNVLRQKIASGLLDGRADLLYVNSTLQQMTLDQPAHRALARTAVEEGATLLRNDNNFLPLTNQLGKGIKKIAVIGPLADNSESTIGGYSQGGAKIITFLGGKSRPDKKDSIALLTNHLLLP